VVIITVLRITDNKISKSTASEFSIKSKGNEEEEEGRDDDSDVISFTIPEPNCHQFHITIIQLLQSVFFSTKFPHARVRIYKDHRDLLVAAACHRLGTLHQSVLALM
jgi:hypothetical protein